MQLGVSAGRGAVRKMAGRMVAMAITGLLLNAPLAPAWAGGPEDRDERAAVSPGVPEEMLGTWSWTTISDLGHRNQYTNQISMPSGMSARFTFLKNGHYKFFFYVRQQTYSLVTEATTNAEGTVRFDGNGTFVLHPVSGHYKGHTGSRVIDRDQTAAELKPTTYYYEWRTEKGQRALYIGPSKASLSRFKQD